MTPETHLAHSLLRAHTRVILSPKFSSIFPWAHFLTSTKSLKSHFLNEVFRKFKLFKVPRCLKSLTHHPLFLAFVLLGFHSPNYLFTTLNNQLLYFFKKCLLPIFCF